MGCGCHTCVGWGRSWVIDVWGGHSFIVGSSWWGGGGLGSLMCGVATLSSWGHHGVSCHHVAPFVNCHVALLATWPLYLGVRRG